MMDLTDEQIDNWRRVLAQVIGPYALIMPKEDIQTYRDHIQNKYQYLLDKLIPAPSSPDAGAPEAEG